MVQDDDGASGRDSIQIEVTSPPPINKDVVLSLNMGEPLNCSIGGSIEVPFIIDGWGDDVGIDITFDPDVIQYGGYNPSQDWTVEASYGDGVIRVRAISQTAIPARNQTVTVATFQFYCPSDNQTQTEIGLKGGKVESEGQDVNILDQIGTMILIQ
jgi:hypothetical protein